MSKPSDILPSIDPGLTKAAKEVLSKFGLSMEAAIKIFLKQVIIHQGTPFEMLFPTEEPL